MRGRSRLRSFRSPPGSTRALCTDVLASAACKVGSWGMRVFDQFGRFQSASEVTGAVLWVGRVWRDGACRRGELLALYRR